ncbi:hypothetical protein [Ralstonia solanacearum]|uniref:hypothetical protein n=1 Tax=Ralstonia solanacearum TaxID=305 RepID=UPI001E3315D8|nr:hypothetical protein [Ralstonia solanacearum]
MSSKLAPQLQDLGKTVAGGVNTGNSDLNEAIGNLAANIAAGGVGLAVGGGSGAATAANVDRFNRQLHKDETDAIHAKANGDAAEEKKLTDAACYRVQCWAQYSPNSDEWAAKFVSQEAADKLVPQLQWVDSQKASSGLFTYTLAEQGLDYAKSQVDMATRGAANLAKETARQVVNLPSDFARKLEQDYGNGNRPPDSLADPSTTLTNGGGGRNVRVCT